MKNIVIIGGGTGISTLLQGLKKYAVNTSVIVSTADDGGSSGILRKRMGVLPPGDIRQCLTSMAKNETLAKFFAYRFTQGELKGHTAGNLLLAGLEVHYKNIEKAIDVCKQLLDVRGAVLPVTLKPSTLTAIFENGKSMTSEHLIDEHKVSWASAIKILKLSPAGPANPKTITAIKNADLIVFGPGDLYTSTLPNLLVQGVAAAINKSKAKKILVTNIMTKFGQTDGFKASDFVKILERYLNGKINIVLQNSKIPPSEVVKSYQKEKAKFVGPDLKSNKYLKVIAANLISKTLAKKSSGDKLKRSLLRHDSEKLAKLIWKLI